MSNLAKIEREAMNLTPAEREHLALSAWESLGDGSDVAINETLDSEGIEIAKLSLWLRTAKKGRKLTSLNENIKCGNSLIDDPDVAGNKAFKWEQEFREVFANGGFDVVISNPPYGAKFTKSEIVYYNKYFSNQS